MLEAKLDAKTAECNTAQGSFERSFCDKAKQAQWNRMERFTNELQIRGDSGAFPCCQANRAWHNYQECYRVVSLDLLRHR